MKASAFNRRAASRHQVAGAADEAEPSNRQQPAAKQHNRPRHQATSQPKRLPLRSRAKVRHPPRAVSSQVSPELNRRLLSAAPAAQPSAAKDHPAARASSDFRLS